MKTALKLELAVVLAISSFVFAGCNNNTGAPPATFTVGGIVLQDNLHNNLAVNANGTFTFATAVPSDSDYSVTISAQPSNPARTCGVINGSGTVTANIRNIQVICGQNEWTWVKGPNSVDGTAVTESSACLLQATTPARGKLPPHGPMRNGAPGGIRTPNLCLEGRRSFN